jgi:hypothetical protein
MPVTLAQAAQNATDAVDLAVINEFRTNPILDLMIFDDIVNPAGGGGTLTYGYRRQETLGTAAFRAINSEYIPTEVTTSKHSVDLKVLGGSYQIDRVLAKVGPSASNEVAFQMQAKIDATKAEFGDAVINGDSAVDEDSFDGLKKALAGSTTEVTTLIDWSGAITEDKGFQLLEDLDNLLALMDGEPSIVLANKLTIAKIKSASRRLNIYNEKPGPRNSVVAAYGNIRLQDAGKKPGTNEDVIPVTAGVTSLYAVRIAQDGFHAVSTVGGQVIQQWQPDFTRAGAVKTGEVEMGPVGVVLKKTKAAAVATNIKLS